MSKRDKREFKNAREVFQTYIPGYRDPSEVENETGAQIGERIAAELTERFKEGLQKRKNGSRRVQAKAT